MIRFLLSIFILTIAIAPAHAQEDVQDHNAISKVMAQQFYENCLAKESPQKLSKESQDLLCSCTAVQIMDNMTKNDIRAMSSQNPKDARLALNHMLVNVYAPCMEYPAKDHYYNVCVSNPQTASLGGDPKKICGCMSDKVANHLKLNGKQIFSDILDRNPNVADPMNALESDKKFQNFVGKQALSCVF